MSSNDVIENNENLYINKFTNFLKECINNTEIEKNESNSTIYNSDNKQEKSLIWRFCLLLQIAEF